MIRGVEKGVRIRRSLSIEGGRRGAGVVREGRGYDWICGRCCWCRRVEINFDLRIRGV